MTTIEKQVCSLELAKRLKELGVKQESLFYWFKNRFKDNAFEVERSDHMVSYGNWIDSYSAFTCSELGEMLPKYSLSGKWQIGFASEYVCRVSQKYFKGVNPLYSKTEADARAKMLIYLIENGLIQAKDLT